MWKIEAVEGFIMKAVAIVALLGVNLAVGAQTPTQAATMHAPDGGTFETIQSIAIFPLTGAPFSATVATELTKILADGTTATVKNKRSVARDSAGRIFQERKEFSPTGDSEPTRTRSLQYIDPNRHEMYDCAVAQKTCYVKTYSRSAMTAMPAGTGGLQACGCAGARGQGYSVQEEELGEKTIENVDVTGSREITTLPAGMFGNEKAQSIVKEFWYSARLGLNLVTKRFDPRSGTQNFVVDHLSLNEPDPKSFEPPSDYRVVRQVVVKQSAQTAH